MSRILVTGGLGFIGSAFVRTFAASHDVLVADRETYAADRARLEPVEHLGVELKVLDVGAPSFLEITTHFSPDVIVHMAAETHVTRSETNPEHFFAVNIESTRNAIEAAASSGALLVHISTDEVYGPAPGSTAFRESDKRPGEGAATSAYARSKALADDLVTTALGEVNGMVLRPTNCYGPWQHPEKAVARWTMRALSGGTVPVWGGGTQIRDWMHVDDACSAIRCIVEEGEPGCVYNVAPEGPELPNRDVASLILDLAGRSPDALILTEYDRPDHDRRYRVDASILRALGWEPRWELKSGLADTVQWYRDNRGWGEKLIPAAESIYQDERPK